MDKPQFYARIIMSCEKISPEQARALSIAMRKIRRTLNATVYLFHDTMTNSGMLVFTGCGMNRINRRFLEHTSILELIIEQKIHPWVKLDHRNQEKQLVEFIRGPHVETLTFDDGTNVAARAQAHLEDLKDRKTAEELEKEGEVDLKVVDIEKTLLSRNRQNKIIDAMLWEYYQHVESMGLTPSGYDKTLPQFHKHLFTLNATRFEDAYKTRKNFDEQAKEPQGIAKTLCDYLSEVQKGISGATFNRCRKVIRNAGHAELVVEACNILMAWYTKIRALWIIGDTNTGKSTFIRYIDDIFATQLIEIRQSYLSQVASKKDFTNNVFTSEEFNVAGAFHGHQDNANMLKLAFEGKETQVSSNKYQPYAPRFGGGARFIIASNVLPPQATTEAD